MTVYVVTWNLNKERSEYARARREFIANLERYENTYDPDLESVRWISTSKSATEVREVLQKKLDGNDCLFVCKVIAGFYDGLLSEEVCLWIVARI